MSELSQNLHAITPVITVITKDYDTSVELSCLRLVESTTNQTTDTKPAEGSGPLTRSATSLITGLAAAAYFFRL